MKSKTIIQALISVVFIAVTLSLIACDDIPGLGGKSSENSQLLWTKLSDNFQWQHQHNKPAVSKYIKLYKNKAYHFKKISERATPYLYHVVSKLEHHKMPGELAILPMVESAYNPHAKSNFGASGLWQLTKDTAKRFGVKQDKWYDGRRDTEDATSAAIDLLKYLNKKFHGDWLLALAAYNAGEGKVNRAIRRNRRAGKSTKFWDLRLPIQTKQFVPKILAIAYLIKHPEELGIKFNHINKPYFAKVSPKSQIDLRVAADLAEIPIKEIRRLNPGYSKHLTHPKGPHKLYLPVGAIAKFNANVAKSTNNNVVNIIPYTIVPGDNLSKIAIQYNTSVRVIKAQNNLSSNKIIAGQELLIPIGKIQKNTTATTATANKKTPKNS